MKLQKVHLVTFSPTKTTQTVLEAIADGIGIQPVNPMNMTLPSERRSTITIATDELVLIGAPVYGGRLPEDAVKRFRRISADGAPAVIVVVYGNREYEDALLELKHLAGEIGLVPVAGAAFIGEHSYATPELPIAMGRPDDLDIRTAMDFGRKIREKTDAMASPDATDDLQVPGRFPYESQPRDLKCAPTVKSDRCTLCGTCADICPTSSISIEERVQTDPETCIKCCACIKNCPESALVMEHPMLQKIAHWLVENYSARKQPELFS